jgi:hypothetical protein
MGVESIRRDDRVREIQTVEEFGEHRDLVRLRRDIGLTQDKALSMGHRCQQVHLGTVGTSSPPPAPRRPTEAEGRWLALGVATPSEGIRGQR